jgi:hypothetical protein
LPNPRWPVPAAAATPLRVNEAQFPTAELSSNLNWISILFESNIDSN